MTIQLVISGNHFISQDNRLDYMDRFFSSIASLMSNLLRTCVQDSLSDLLTLIECYMDGNDYSGQYNIMTGLGLPTKIHMLKIYLVNICLFACFKDFALPNFTLTSTFEIFIYFLQYSNLLRLISNISFQILLKMVKYSVYISLLITCISLKQNIDVPDVSTNFEPSFDVVQHHLSDIVDVIVTSTSHFPCIEHLLFHSVENLPTRYIRSVGQNEQLVLNTRRKIQNVVNKNSCGPTR